MSENDNRVSSELYEEFDYSTAITPSLNDENVVSRFAFDFPHSPTAPVTDADGDLVVTRRNSQKCEIKIEHSKRTELNLVGLQIWRGALLLADWLIHNRQSFTRDTLIMELGSGVGLTSIVAGMFAPVVCTDIDVGGLLNLIKSNVKINESYLRYPVTVLELDFTKDLSPEIMELLPKAQIILAADVVYDNDLTDAFIATVQKLMNIPPKRSIYIALEKRFVFTIADCDTCAPCYEYFKECLRQVKNASIEELTLDFPQYFVYDRVKELVLWKVTSKC
ncbi:methyltransferase-like protein 22 [Atheta coriaria]|uniref:methyltransferase-like protein 22 n=1 Tax=Dalotia coriaria TaxID=877792 RepID=UPI0031F3C884